jgi:hypothetical protein
MIVGPTTVNKALGKGLYSNFNSLSSNLHSSLRRIKAQSQSNLGHVGDDNLWENDTHIKQLDNIYTQNVIDTIHSKFTDIIQKEKNINTITHKGDVYQRSIDNYGDNKFNFEDNFSAIEKLLNPEIRNLLESYYNSHFSVDYIKLYRYMKKRVYILIGGIQMHMLQTQQNYL